MPFTHMLMRLELQPDEELKTSIKHAAADTFRLKARLRETIYNHLFMRQRHWATNVKCKKKTDKNKHGAKFLPVKTWRLMILKNSRVLLTFYCLLSAYAAQ